MLPFVPAIVEAVLKVHKQTNKQTNASKLCEQNGQMHKRRSSLAAFFLYAFAAILCALRLRRRHQRQRACRGPTPTPYRTSV
jgi:hypothetical protein